MNTICPYCKEPLSTEMVIKYKYAQFYCNTMIYAVVPKLFSRCCSCHKEITYSESNFYTLYYLEVMKNYIEKVCNAKKEM